jgi:hypothetical protein
LDHSSFTTAGSSGNAMKTGRSTQTGASWSPSVGAHASDP